MFSIVSISTCIYKIKQKSEKKNINFKSKALENEDFYTNFGNIYSQLNSLKIQTLGVMHILTDTCREKLLQGHLY